MKKQIEMKFSKETKNTFVYKTKDEDSPISSLYLMKSHMPSEVPKKVAVTVEFE